MEATLEELNRREWKTKSWITVKGVRCGGALFTEGTLTRLLTNELYTGWVVYKGKRYRGEHAAMVDGREWRRVSCVVSFRDQNNNEWSHVTAADGLFEAVRNAMQFFSEPFWTGPRPNAETVFKIRLVGDDRTWRVRAGVVMKRNGERV